MLRYPSETLFEVGDFGAENTVDESVDRVIENRAPE